MEQSIQQIMETMSYGPARENPAEALKWLDSHNRKFGLFINGVWAEPKEQGYFDTFSPADETKLASVSMATHMDVSVACEAARDAQESWQAIGGFERAKYLYAMARQIQKHARLYSVLETLNNGKPIRESRDADIPLVIRHFYYHAGCAKLMETKFANYRPLGVVGQIIPWNFPLLMLAWKIAPALAAGNTVVLKPAEQTPLTALLFAELCQEIDLPKGVVNIITGDGKTGQEMINHPGFDKYAFTGSTAVGRKMAETMAGTGKSLTLELGGKSPFIVFEKADLDSAVEGVSDAIWFNQGEVCCAGSRLLLQESIAETFVQKLKQKMDTIRLGHPLEKNIDMGSIISKHQCDKISSIVQQSVQSGCEIYQPTHVLPDKGYYYPPTLLNHVDTTSAAFTDEIFGPVLAGTTFRTFDEAVELANHTRYGLSASIWSEDINQALGIVPKVQAGVIWINSTNLFDASCEFGGVKESGYGREGGLSGMHAYMKIKLKPGSRVSAQHDPTGIIINDVPENNAQTNGNHELDKTQKLFINGKQVRPDGGYSLAIRNPKSETVALVGKGNAKDIRNAVEAAVRASDWRYALPALRSQIIYFIAENFERRKAEYVKNLVTISGQSRADAEKEVHDSIQMIIHFAAMADKYEGQVKQPLKRGLTLTIPEPTGVIGIVAPDDCPLPAPLIMAIAAIAMGNRVILIPSENNPLPMTDFYQVIETSDVPPGVFNIVTGLRADMLSTLAGHYAVDAVWYMGSKEDCRIAEYSAAGNLKRTFCSYGEPFDWTSPEIIEILLQHATEHKTVWIPYGE